MDQKDPIFLTKAQVLLYHDEQLALYKGSAGIRDEGLLESALAAPQHLYCYVESADVFDLSASYLRALAQNHPFLDGNKRTALEAAIAFLKLNGWQLEMDPPYLTLLVERLVTKSCDEAFVADFFFIACCRNAEKLFALENLSEAASPSFLAAQTDEERYAIVVDVVSAAFRIRLMQVCANLMVRPDRFTNFLERLEDRYFRQVDKKWRRQFGMGLSTEP